mmetsp:Transcript_7483/g.21313  ORF Transcript_7483/g.21313 Transcript_7483/m.21313 type:complete len:504 (-) Transcript_7483:279-1790(-)
MTGSPKAVEHAAEYKPWTADNAVELQQALDKIFEPERDSLGGLQFSVTIADPQTKDCHLIGCSHGFTTLVGYSMEEIVGRNCRFLIEPVPKDLINTDIRKVSRDFCDAVRDGQTYTMPEEFRQDYMPTDKHKDDGVFLMQMNARKDGRLFRNMFYLRAVSLNERPFILGLQTELPDDVNYQTCHQACRVLDHNVAAVETFLATKFWFQGPMRRQDQKQRDDGYLPGAVEKGTLKKPWSQENSDQLQAAVDRIFAKVGGSEDLRWLKLSLTIADPLIDGCPLVGCSTGFATLTGYTMDDIVGRNCRFLVDPVPKDLVNQGVRTIARDFCKAVREGTDYSFPLEQLQSWMPPRTGDDQGVFCAQMNADKDGVLFENMFYMARIELDEHPYIVGLQTKLPDGTLATAKGDAKLREGDKDALESCYTACRILDRNMGAVERALAPYFWLTVPMRRQEMMDDNLLELAPDPEPREIQPPKKPINDDDLKDPTRPACGCSPALTRCTIS